LYDNGRITIMFCSFGLQPLIVRLFGIGNVFEVRSCQDLRLMRSVVPRYLIRYFLSRSVSLLLVQSFGSIYTGSTARVDMLSQSCSSSANGTPSAKWQRGWLEMHFSHGRPKTDHRREKNWMITNSKIIRIA